MTMLVFKFIKPPKKLPPPSCPPPNNVGLYGFWWANKTPFFFSEMNISKHLRMGRYRMVLIHDGSIGPVMQNKLLEKTLSSSHWYIQNTAVMRKIYALLLLAI